MPGTSDDGLGISSSSSSATLTTSSSKLQQALQTPRFQALASFLDFFESEAELCNIPFDDVLAAVPASHHLRLKALYSHLGLWTAPTTGMPFSHERGPAEAETTAQSLSPAACLALSDALFLFQSYLEQTSQMVRSVPHKGIYLYPHATVTMDIAVFVQVFRRLLISGIDIEFNSGLTAHATPEQLRRILDGPPFYLTGDSQVSTAELRTRFTSFDGLPDHQATWDLYFPLPAGEGSPFVRLPVAAFRYGLFRTLVSVFYEHCATVPLFTDILTLRPLGKS